MTTLAKCSFCKQWLHLSELSSVAVKDDPSSGIRDVYACGECRLALRVKDGT